MTEQDSSTDAADKPAPRINSPDRSQADPHPKRIDELISVDHTVRLIWALVEGLDMAPLLDPIKSVEGRAGRPAIDPRILVALWLYATDEGIASAHELARRCTDCDPYKWLCGGVHVNYHTLADFRVRHHEWLSQQVVATIAAMRAEGLASLEKLGQDGMRVRANAGNDSFKKAEKLGELLDEAEQQWQELQEKFEQSPPSSSRERAAQERAAKERIERLKQAQAEVKEVAEQREKRKKGDGQTARASTTDPEARRMKMGDGGTRPAYNVQFDTDLDSLVIMGADVVQAGSDSGQMEPMVQQIEANHGPLPDGSEYYVDGGFASNADLESLGQRGVTVYSPVKAVEKKKQKGEDPYAPKPGDTPHVAAWRQRMGTLEAQEKYGQRCKTEFPNATSRNRGLRQFLVRRLAKVKTVVLWYVMIHNLLRMVTLRAERISPAACT